MRLSTFAVLSLLVVSSFGCVSTPSEARMGSMKSAAEEIAYHPLKTAQITGAKTSFDALMLAPMLLGQVSTEYVTDAHTVWGDPSVTDTNGGPASADLYEVAVSPSTVDISKTNGAPTRSITATPADFTGKVLKVGPLFVGAAKDSTWNLYARAHRAGHPPGLMGPWSAPIALQYQSLPMAAPNVRIELIIKITGTP